jgi:hypothetical protein
MVVSAPRTRVHPHGRTMDDRIETIQDQALVFASSEAKAEAKAKAKAKTSCHTFELWSKPLRAGSIVKPLANNGLRNVSSSIGVHDSSLLVLRTNSYS